MEKINIAELLKDCPNGMELDCTMYDNLHLDEVEEECIYPIWCYTIYDGCRTPVNFTEFGEFNNHETAKCVIFPKGKTSWQGFVPPCHFKDGDVVSTMSGYWIGITEGGGKNTFIPTYCVLTSNGEFKAYFDEKGKWGFNRLATEEETQKLFQAIKDNGYRWNKETKTLEKLIEPYFKVGDRIKAIGSDRHYIIKNIKIDRYILNNNGFLKFTDEHIFELVPNKFDITTLKPFDSRVLVRNSYEGFWMPTFWGIYETERANRHLHRHYLTTKGFFLYCIPYNDDTKHLLGTTDDCDNYYKTWE